MLNIKDVNVLLVVPGKGTSSNIRSILRDFGIDEINAGASLKFLTTQLTEQTPDLIICNAEFPDGNSSDLVRDIRLNGAGHNPFIPIITITASATEDSVRRIISSGTDALIIEPFTSQQIHDRLDGVVNSRKQFVATSDYLGPDRRPGSRGASDMEILKFDVPNTLRSKVIGEDHLDDLDVMINTTMGQMTNSRLERQSQLIVLITEQVSKSFAQGEPTQKVQSYAKNLQETLNDVMGRIKGTNYEHASGLCATLLQVAFDIGDNESNVTEKNIQLITQLALAINVGFDSSKDDSVARAISDTVSHI